MNEKTKCVIIDKDFTLLGVMKHILPNAQIILCTFHVAKTFRKETSNIQCTSAERDTDRKSLASMLYAKSEKNYQTSFDELKKDAPEKFLRYFSDNWDRIKETWVRCYVDANGHLGNHTTNRTEAYHSTLKRFLPPKQSLSEMIRGLHLYNQGVHASHDYNALRIKMTQPINVEATDSVLKQYSDFATETAATEIRKRLATARQLQKGATVETTSHSYEVKSVATSSSEWIVDKECLGCNCPHFRTNLLPCKHIFLVRLHLQIPLFDKNLIHERWLHDDKWQLDGRVTTGSVTIKQQAFQPAKPIGRGTKYSKMMAVCKQIAGVCSEHSTKHFMEETVQLDILLKQWTLGNQVYIAVHLIGPYFQSML